MAMYEFIERNAITVMFMTTQLAWQMVTLFDFSSIRLFGCGGEKLPPLEPRKFRFMNVYGPTECSVMATAFDVNEPTDGRIIGRPIPGYEVYILDSSLRHMPVGFPGEIVIAGDSVALDISTARNSLPKSLLKLTVKGLIAPATRDDTPLRVISNSLEEWTAW